MRIFGYGDRWTVKAGEVLNFMATSELGDYRADIVRLFQVDDRREGPGYREQEIEAACNGTYPGRTQHLRPGSYLRVPNDPRLEPTRGLTIVAWIYPTLPARGVQGIVAKRARPNGPGYALLIDAEGYLRFEIGTAGASTMVSAAEPLRQKVWQFVAARFEGQSGAMSLTQMQVRALAPHHPAPARALSQAVHAGAGGFAGPCKLLIAALHEGASDEVVGHFNGKIDSPRIFARSLSDAELAALGSDAPPSSDGLIAAWDFGATPYGLEVPDRSGNGLAATVVNNPMRGVTGRNWDSDVGDYLTDPDRYAAIYFHDDDLEDAAWEVDFGWRVPADLPSGVYAARLRAGDEEDYIPFFVRPSTPSAPIAFLAPTFTYLAYANERFHAQPWVDWDHAADRPLSLSRQDAFTAAHGHELGGSVYDVHTDGSINVYTSRLRPVLNLRPKLTAYWNDAGRHFGADMYLIDWLDRKGFDHDVVTDEDLHHEGLELLRPYRVIITGSHPEYFTLAMRRAFERYLAEGGRLMYLGGNGCWWVTSVDPVRPHAIEVRKQDSWKAVTALGVEPGEERHSTTGERGGSWRGARNGPETLFGVGYTSQGFCQARPYRRQPASFDPRVAFIFEGIGEDELIGDFGLGLGGAAGDEFDRVNYALGSPPETMILASSSGHSEQYCLNFSLSYQPTEEIEASVRADLAYYETDSGGAVFSVGSMCWCPSLPHDGYDNNVARITENVLRRFSAT